MTDYAASVTQDVDVPLWLDASGLRARLGYAEAANALERAFAAVAAYGSPERETLTVPDGQLMLMPAWGPEGAGVKLVTLTPANPAVGLPFIQGMYVLFAAESQRAIAVIDGAALTELRTAAVSAFATRVLARPDARRLVIFGAGVQARAHADALRAVCPALERVDVVGRDADRVARLVARLRAQGWEAEAGRADVVGEADVVCTCTTAGAPLFAAEQLRPGAHVNAIGAYRPDRRELDAALLASATVVVEERAAALAEAGDLVLAIADGAYDADAIAGDLSDLATGVIGRGDERETTVFKSVGLALEDLVVAHTAVVAR